MNIIRIKNSDETIDVENIYCVGKNYYEHIKEFEPKNAEVDIPKEPVIFLKPNTSLNTFGQIVKIPVWKGERISVDLQNEVELVVVISKDGINISESDAHEFIFGYAVGIDFTLRDIQSELKGKGLPWTLSKGFLSAACVSEAVKENEVKNVQDLRITLKVNNEIKQNSNTSEMIFGVNYIISYISSIFGLKKGDIIFTGTPAGVTTLREGDIVEASIENIGELKVHVG